MSAQILFGFRQRRRLAHSSKCEQASEKDAFVSLLRACTKSKDLCRGSKLHHDISTRGNNLLRSCSDALVTMYATCGALKKADELFDVHTSKDVFTWTALIAGHERKGHSQVALDYFERMQHAGVSPNAVTFICILKACANLRAAHMGDRIYDEIAKQGLFVHDKLGTAVVDMYAKCGALAKARGVLEQIPVRDVVSWTALMAGYAEHGECEQALNCLEQMQGEGISPNEVTFICVLKACGGLGAADEGERIHHEIAELGLLEKNVVLGNALVDMYVKCGALTKARRVLEELPIRNVVSWNSLIAGYAEHGEGAHALECYEKMCQEGFSADAVTFITILKSCGGIKAVDKGEKVYNEIAEQGLLQSNIVLGTVAVDMYVKCGALARARQVLEELPSRNVISWTVLIAGYAERGEGAQALSCFEQMQREGLSPDAATFIYILKACACLGASDKGEKIHHELAKQGLLGREVVLGTALVDMYAKCGALVKARQMLGELPVQNVIAWTALLAGYAQQGEGEQALHCFEQLQREGISPNAVTFSCVLSACSRLRLVANAETYFVDMRTKYGMEPDLQHYAGMVDLFGRAGHLDKAVSLLEKLSSSHSGAWSALLGACQKWGDMDVGRWVFESGVQEGTHDLAVYFHQMQPFGGPQRTFVPYK